MLRFRAVLNFCKFFNAAKRFGSTMEMRVWSMSEFLFRLFLFFFFVDDWRQIEDELSWSSRFWGRRFSGFITSLISRDILIIQSYKSKFNHASNGNVWDQSIHRLLYSQYWMERTHEIAVFCVYLENMIIGFLLLKKKLIKINFRHKRRRFFFRVISKLFVFCLLMSNVMTDGNKGPIHFLNRTVTAFCASSLRFGTIRILWKLSTAILKPLLISKFTQLG